jgi:hypothetical protein
VALGLLTVLAAPLAWRTPATAAPADLLPDLAMARPLDLHIQRLAGGRRMLRLTTMIVNVGAGPLETRASRNSAAAPFMQVKQRIYNSGGGYRVVNTTAMARYSGDGHDHWHIQRVASYELYPVAGTAQAVARSSKVGFCFYDTRRYRPSLPGAPSSRRYGSAGCGTRTARTLRHGISVGWADRYGSELAFQAIDVSGLPAGDYYLKVTADPNGDFLELSEPNNCNWTRVRIRTSGTLLSVLGWGAGCALPGTAASPTPVPTSGPGPTPTPAVTPLPTEPSPSPAAGLPGSSAG